MKDAAAPPPRTGSSRARRPSTDTTGALLGAVGVTAPAAEKEDEDEEAAFLRHTTEMEVRKAPHS